MTKRSKDQKPQASPNDAPTTASDAPDLARLSSGDVLDAIVGPEGRQDAEASSSAQVLRREMPVEAIFYDGTLASGDKADVWDVQLQFIANNTPAAKNPHYLGLFRRNHYLTKKGVLNFRHVAGQEIKPDRWIVRDALGNIHVHTDQDFRRLYR